MMGKTIKKYDYKYFKFTYVKTNTLLNNAFFFPAKKTTKSRKNFKRKEPLKSPESQQVNKRRKPRGWSFAFGSAFTREASANFEG